MSSSLSVVPLERRRRAAWAAGLLAAVMLIVFVLAWVRPAPGVVRLFGALALAGAVLLGLMTWGVVRSIRLDRADAALDAAIASTGAVKCGCGRDHDHDELHLTDATCERGASCDHSCAACVLAARSSDGRPRSETDRPIGHST
jgi:hypothetical protein